MKGLLIVLLALSLSAFADDFIPYITIGPGMMIQGPDSVMLDGHSEPMDFGGTDTALIEIGIDKGPISFGLKHDSQWSTGWPVNKQEEYYKTELFIRYKYQFESFSF